MMQVCRFSKCPNLRFPEFEGEWEEKMLGEVCDEFKSGNFIKADTILTEGKYPVYGGNGLRGYTNTYNREGQYILIGRQGAQCGNINWILGTFYATEHAIAVITNKENNTFFLGYLLDKMRLGRLSDQSAQPGLAVNKLVKIKVILPSIVEQNKIVDLISLIDQRINTQIKIIEELESLKKGLLKKMLSINKQPMPELRFPQHNEIWIKKKIKDIAKVITGSTPPTNQRENYGRNFLWATPPDLSGKKYITTTYKMLSVKGSTLTRHIPEDSILMSCIGIIGKLGISTEKMCTNQQINSLILHQFIDVNFAYYVMANNAKRYSMYAATQVVPILSKSLLEEQILYVPSYEEQVKIGTLLSLIDKKIELEQSTLESQKKQKYYLLQNLFI